MNLKTFTAQVHNARARIGDLVRKTPLEHSVPLSEIGQANVYVKLESEQITGSFKVRGACNKICLLGEQHPDIRVKTPITASTGNHGLACSYAMQKAGIRATVYASKAIVDVKAAALKQSGAELVLYGDDCLDAELKARETAEKEGRIFISPYNDWDIVAGTGTIGQEILEQLKDVDVVFIPVGGGGLFSGIAAYMKACKPEVKIVGCQPVMSKVMFESVKAGKIIYEPSEETLSDGTAGGVEEGSITFEMCRDYVDDWACVTEDEIARAIYLMMEHHHKIVEGAAGVAIGAYMKDAGKYKDKNVVIIASGTNIRMEIIKDIVNRFTK